jgi:hypothetical protein
MSMTRDTVPFSIWNRGKNILTGVDVAITNMREYQEARARGDDHRVNIGTLPPEWPKMLPAIHPEIDFDGIGHYQAEIWTQNGYYNEQIQLRKAKNRNSWASRYYLTKQFPKTGKSTLLIKDCQRWEWSDGSKD